MPPSRWSLGTAMIPTEGVCQACYVLAVAAQMAADSNIEDWIARASRVPAGLGVSKDIDAIARVLLKAKLITVQSGRILLSPQFPPCHDGCDRLTKLKIAKMLLGTIPPPWLNRAAATSYSLPVMPDLARRQLSWMEEDMLAILAEAATHNVDPALAALGEVGEEVVLATTRQTTADAIRVSLISNAYGFDILVPATRAAKQRRLEVKCTLDTQDGGFFLSRNEFEASRRWPAEWSLIQVILNANAFWNSRLLGPSSIMTCRSLAAADILNIVLPDTSECSWQESVRCTAPTDSWHKNIPDIPTTWRIINPLFRED
jgi:hypothetical protein